MGYLTSITDDITKARKQHRNLSVSIVGKTYQGTDNTRIKVRAFDRRTGEVTYIHSFLDGELISNNEKSPLIELWSYIDIHTLHKEDLRSSGLSHIPNNPHCAADIGD